MYFIYVLSDICPINVYPASQNDTGKITINRILFDDKIHVRKRFQVKLNVAVFTRVFKKHNIIFRTKHDLPKRVRFIDI